MKNKKLEKLLFKSFDSTLSDEEASTLKKELQESEELKETYEQISKIRNAVHNSADNSFKPFFEERLLNKLNYERKSEGSIVSWPESLAKSFQKVAVAAVIILALLIFYNVNQGNNSSIENLLGIYKTPIEYVLDPTLHLLGSEI